MDCAKVENGCMQSENESIAPLGFVQDLRIETRQEEFSANQFIYWPERASAICHKTLSGLVQRLGRSHGGLDVQRTDVLPVLLQERNQVVDGERDVGRQLILVHTDVSDGDRKAQHL